METTTPSLSGLEPLLSIEELSDYLHVRVKTRYDWRLTGRGPRAVHVGRQLRFFISDVLEWLTDQREQKPGRGTSKSSPCRRTRLARNAVSMTLFAQEPAAIKRRPRTGPLVGVPPMSRSASAMESNSAVGPSVRSIRLNRPN
jgi:predicted DNA-binding transcriptional regulator AlpA